MRGEGHAVDDLTADALLLEIDAYGEIDMGDLEGTRADPARRSPR